jgi:hypothetical protein
MEESGRNPLWPGIADPTKGRIHLRRPNCRFNVSLAILRRTIHTDNQCTLTLPVANDTNAIANRRDLVFGLRGESITTSESTENFL